MGGASHGQPRPPFQLTPNHPVPDNPPSTPRSPLSPSAPPALDPLEPRTLFALPRPDHVVLVIEENHSPSSIIANPQAPYLNSLAKSGALLTNAHANFRPSQPNYLALFAGANFGVTTNDTVNIGNRNNLASQLIGYGRTFTGYAESLPAIGSTVASAGAYARKHNPWVDFSNVPSSDNRPFSTFPTDFTRLPTVSFVVPNLNDDSHDGTVAQSDTWLHDHLGAYAAWAKTHNSLMIVTYDEGDGADSANRIATIFYGARVKPGQYATAVTHYNVLRTLESMYALPPMNNAATAAPIDYVWTTSSTPPPPTGVPAAPTNLTARPSTTVANAIDLAWKDNASDETGYRIERSTDGINFYPLAGTGPNVTANRNTNLTPGKRYYYRVYAVNAAGRSPYSNTASAVLPTAASVPPLTPSPFSTAALVPEDPLWA